MTKASIEDPSALPAEADMPDGVTPPWRTREFFGHEEARGQLAKSYQSGRLPSAIILGGPRGIGKATLAFHFARFLRTYSSDADNPEGLLTLDEAQWNSRASQLIAAGADPDLIHIRRPYVPSTGRFARDLPIDEVRRARAFFSRTAERTNWRICIVDAAEDMNINSANALLKILEEPPRRSVILVISHKPHALLPTLRSRCQQIMMKPLAHADLEKALIALTGKPGLLSADLLPLTEGSIRRALHISGEEIGNVMAGFSELSASWPKIDIEKLHRLADLFLGPKADPAWNFFPSLCDQWFKNKLEQAVAKSLSRGMQISLCHTRTMQALQRCDAFQLDRKQTFINIAREMASLPG